MSDSYVKLKPGFHNIEECSQSPRLLINSSAFVAILKKPDVYFASNHQQSQRLPTIEGNSDRWDKTMVARANGRNDLVKTTSVAAIAGFAVIATIMIAVIPVIMWKSYTAIVCIRQS